MPGLFQHYLVREMQMAIRIGRTSILPMALFLGVLAMLAPTGAVAQQAVVPFQLIAYELSILFGRNPDRPRNLAKAVTVD